MSHVPILQVEEAVARLVSLMPADSICADLINWTPQVALTGMPEYFCPLFLLKRLLSWLINSIVIFEFFFVTN
jgi:hypothetical protein